MATKEQSPPRTQAPKLRFPEFKESWDTVPLNVVAEPVSDRVGTSDCVPYTVTSGVGLVSQDEKLGRTIAGKSLSNYIRLLKNDFAYNKSATKAFPEGYIARYLDDASAAVPNSIFACFRGDPKKIDLAYLDFLFASNLHGRWLRKFLTVGARAHGSLNVKEDDLMALPVPMPGGDTSHVEQRKIAACLTSLDELLAAEGRKLEALAAHKKGLMQQLFPREGKSQPRLRFPEYRGEPEWVTVSVGEMFETTSGGTPDRARKEYWGGAIPWITTSLVDFNMICEAEEFITEAGLENSAAKLFPKGTVLVALYGQGATRGKVAMLGIEATTNQACGAILPVSGFDPAFTFLSLSGRYDEMRSLSNPGGQENLSQALIRELPFHYPKHPAERARLVACLSSLDALLAAASLKLDGLLAHKKGLMQQLFPSPEGK
jgi:type I restriction enzyme S subunit